MDKYRKDAELIYMDLTLILDMFFLDGERFIINNKLVGGSWCKSKQNETNTEPAPTLHR